MASETCGNLLLNFNLNMQHWNYIGVICVISLGQNPISNIVRTSIGNNDKNAKKAIPINTLDLNLNLNKLKMKAHISIAFNKRYYRRC